MRLDKSFPESLWLQTAMLLTALIPLTLLAMAFEQRTFNEINLWIKPLKFQTSAVIHLLTLAFAASLMTDEARRKKVLITLVWLSAIATTLEIFIVTLRASQATASHYNYSTPTDILIYSLMGVGAVTMLLPAIYLGICFLRTKSGSKGQVGLRFGIGVGFVVGSILTLLFAGYMSSNGSHWTSGQLSDANGLTLFGWSQTGGDLRPAHFFALHMMQVLPVVGLIGDRFLVGHKVSAKMVVCLAFVLMAGLSTFSFIQALNGHPFVAL